MFSGKVMRLLIGCGIINIRVTRKMCRDKRSSLFEIIIVIKKSFIKLAKVSFSPIPPSTYNNKGAATFSRTTLSITTHSIMTVSIMTLNRKKLSKMTLKIMANSRKTLNRMILSRMTRSRMTVSIMTLNRMKLIIMTLRRTKQYNDKQQKDI